MNKIKVLIIDDSAFARKVIREVLSRDSSIEIVGIARDGLEGLEKINELRPDVVTLDLVMPDLDGIGLLKALQSSWSPKIIVVSVSNSDTELAIEALHNGAVDIVAKPTPLASDRLYELSDELVRKVKMAASANRVVRSPEIPVKQIADLALSQSTTSRLIVIGTSTGGPQALSELFKALPAGLPVPIAVALHIPAGYTAALAARISQNGLVPMWEAQDGMELKAGQAVIAPGGMHLKIRAEGQRLFAVVTRDPIATPHHPSVNVLFESAAAQVGRHTIGLVMTGMGDDGTIGAAAIRKSGGQVLAESASSCVVYGMPRTVIEAGLASGEAPLESLANLLVQTIFSERPLDPV